MAVGCQMLAQRDFLSSLEDGRGCRCIQRTHCLAPSDVAREMSSLQRRFTCDLQQATRTSMRCGACSALLREGKPHVQAMYARDYETQAQIALATDAACLPHTTAPPPLLAAMRASMQ